MKALIVGGSSGMGKETAEIPLMTFIRHTIFGLTLGVLVSKWFKSSSDKSDEKIMKKIGGGNNI